MVTRRERKKATIRAGIVRAAIALFERHGIEGVTVEQIADAADIGKGTVYNYFPSKEAVVVGFMTDLERQIQGELRVAEIARRPPTEALAEFVRVQFRLKTPHHRFVRVFFAEMFLRTESFLPYMAEISQLLTPNLTALFTALQQRGAIRSDRSADELAAVFGTVQFGLSAQWAIEGPPFRGTDDLLDRAVALFCEGLTRNMP